MWLIQGTKHHKGYQWYQIIEGVISARWEIIYMISLPQFFKVISLEKKS